MKYLGKAEARQKQDIVKAERSCRLDSEELTQTVTETLSLNGASLLVYFRFQWPIILANYPSSCATCVACP